MIKGLRLRFWLEAGMATLTGILFVVTLVWRNWIEIVFGVEPDGGSGSLEWLILGVTLIVTIILFVLARYEWRIARTALPSNM
jgi:hypothetical protein